MTVDKSKKNILIIVQHLSRGGAEKCAANLSMMLSEEFNVYIIIFFSEEFFKISYEYHGELHCLNQPLPTSLFQKSKNTIHRITALRKFKKKYNIDLSISFLFSADFPNIISRGKDKTLIAISTYLSSNVATMKKKHWIKTFYPRADKLVALNARGRKDLIENFNVDPHKATVIPNFYDTEQITKNAKAPLLEWSNTEQYLKLLQVGRFSHPKGQWHLLRIFKHVLAKVPNARLNIVGQGDLKEFLKNYAETIGLRVQDLEGKEDKTPDFDNHDVIFTGFCSNPFKYMRAADLFLFTSIYEGFPNAIAEAMVCSSTVLSSNCTTGPQELIAPDVKGDIEQYPLQTDYGILFPPFDGEIPAADAPILSEEQLWVDAITAYAADKMIFDGIGVKAKERIKEYDKSNVKTAWIKLCQNV